MCLYICLAECLQDEGARGEAFNFSAENPMTVLEKWKLAFDLEFCLCETIVWYRSYFGAGA